LTIAIAAAVVGAIIVAVFVFGGDRAAGDVTARQLTSMDGACAGWTGASAPAVGDVPADRACTAMVTWMRQQLADGRMTPTVMWGDATAARATCQEWMADAGGASTEPTAWCAAMVDWMRQHLDDGTMWMHGGPMMGR
jgi:hypothetical protein